MDVTLQPNVLRWARERAGLDLETLAKRLQVKEDRIVAWEQSGQLTFPQVRNLADATHIPLGYLFLSEPVQESLPIKDFRTVEMQPIQTPSIDLLDTVYDAKLRQDWYRDYIIAEGGQPLDFVGSLTVSDNVKVAAGRIRSRLSQILNQQFTFSSWEDALSGYVNSIRALRVLVIRSSNVRNDSNRRLQAEEFRGFALSDNYAPLIFINGDDAKPAQIFTLMHEFVHIWLGESGVSNLQNMNSPDVEIERFCNSVAAEILVPLEQLKSMWVNSDHTLEAVAQIARYFKVSNLVILRRLYDAQYLSYEEFQTRYISELEQAKQRIAQRKKRGGEHYVNARSSLGEQFLYALISSTIDGKTPYRDATELLGVTDPQTIDNLSKKMGMGL